MNSSTALVFVSFQRALILVLLVGSTFAESDADPESDAGADAFISPYRTYNSAKGFPYRKAYYSPYAFAPRPIVSRQFAPVFRQSYSRPAQLNRPAPSVRRAPAPAPAPATSYVKDVYQGSHLKAVPAVPHKPMAAPVARVAPATRVAPAVPVAPAAHVAPAVHAAPAARVSPAPRVAQAIPVAPAAPVVKAAPVARAVAYEHAPSPLPTPIQPTDVNQVIATQFHTQDEFGNVAYGYANPNSAKEERRDAYGNVRGAYSYIDETGYPKHVAYIADDYGFRVTSSNALPVPNH